MIQKHIVRIFFNDYINLTNQHDFWVCQSQLLVYICDGARFSRSNTNINLSQTYFHRKKRKCRKLKFLMSSRKDLMIWKINLLNVNVKRLVSHPDILALRQFNHEANSVEFMTNSHSFFQTAKLQKRRVNLASLD